MKPLILLTNDDGIASPGLLASIEAAMPYGELLVVAPHTQQTGMGRAFPRNIDTGMIEEFSLFVDGQEIVGYGVHGSPAFAVAHGVLELASRKPDLCVSGINYGENVGMVLSCSGTVGAILEGCSHGVPGIAVSLEVPLSMQRCNDFQQQEWKYATKIVSKWIQRTLREGMPYQAKMLNINIPNEQLTSEEYRITRQSRQNYFEFIKPEKRELDKPFALQSKMYIDEEDLETDSDIYAIYKERITSVTPITWDMTVKNYSSTT